MCFQKDVPLAQKGHLNRLANVGLFLVCTGAFFARFPISFNIERLYDVTYACACYLLIFGDFGVLGGCYAPPNIPLTSP